MIDQSLQDRQQVRAFLAGLLNRNGEEGSFNDTESLVSSGRLSSLDVLEIVTFLEHHYGIDFADRPFDQQMVDSAAEILGLIAEAAAQSKV